MFLLLRRDTIIFSTTVFAKHYILRIVRLIPLKLNQKGKMIHKSRAGFCFLCLLMLLAVFQSYVYEMTQKNICFICHNIFQINKFIACDKCMAADNTCCHFVFKILMNYLHLDVYLRPICLEKSSNCTESTFICIL